MRSTPKGGAAVLRLNAAEGAVVAQGPAPGSEMRPVLTRTVVRPVPNARSGAVLVHGQVKRAGRGGVRVRVTRRAGHGWVSVRAHTTKIRSRGASSGASVVSPAAAAGFVRCSWARIEPARRRQPDGSLCAAEPERL